MNQLFYNLIGNALKFSKPDAAPVIEINSRILSKEEVLRFDDLNSRWPYCEITVKDNGIGFNQEFAEQIFTIFQRLHGRSEYEGNGIGLGLCKKIMDNHDGEIYARSVAGEGSTFHVIIPLKRNYS
jgi:two-component system CheB/CheR fusion protein